MHSYLIKDLDVEAMAVIGGYQDLLLLDSFYDEDVAFLLFGGDSVALGVTLQSGSLLVSLTSCHSTLVPSLRLIYETR